MQSKLFIISITFLNLCYNSFGIYVVNASKVRKIETKPEIWTESEIWGPVLEEWVLNNNNYRQSKVIQLIPIQNISESNAPNTQNLTQDERESKISPGIKIVNNGSGAKKPQQITETDMYLLGAIEKLVYKVDFMEKRLRRVEEMLYYVMAGNKMDQEPCPNNFNRAGINCYLFAGTAGRELDWKAANKQCKKYGAVLAEMETIEENQDVIAYVQNQGHLRGRDYWVGGLNPGLLWIWSNSARPIKAPGSNKQDADPASAIGGKGRCLRLAYNPALRSYAYQGTDCATRFSYICEFVEHSTSNELRRLGRSKQILSEDL